MKDIQGNELKILDIVYTCVNGKSKRLREGVVVAIGDTGKTADIASFEDNTIYITGWLNKNNKTAATIVRAGNQDNSRIPKDLLEYLKETSNEQ